MIRPANTRDLPAMREMDAQVRTAAHWNEQVYQRLFTGDSPRLALVIEEEVVQGFLVARQVGPEWELENIVIRQPAQGRGLGTTLLRHFLVLLRQQGAESVFLEVRASNAAARALYAREGFVETGRRPRYYDHPPEDAILYRLLLSPTT